jgi:hypothetical protein
MRTANEDDFREDLELAVMELQDRFGVAPSSIRRYVNNALKATERDGIRGTVFLFKAMEPRTGHDAHRDGAGGRFLTPFRAHRESAQTHGDHAQTYSEGIGTPKR